MDECAVCGRRGVSLLWAHHKERGGIWICAECWKKLYEDNMLVYGSGESGCSC